jgi:tetratricopeptide (TPR) repeat protein
MYKNRINTNPQNKFRLLILVDLALIPIFSIACSTDNDKDICEAFYNNAQYDMAIECHESALENDLNIYGSTHPNVARLWNNLGLAWRAKGQYDKAIEYYEKALESDLKSLGAEHPQVAVVWNNLGLVWVSKGEYDKAIMYFEYALKSDLKNYGETHLNVARDWNSLGGAWNAKGDFGKAMVYFEKAFNVCREKLGINHPKTNAVRKNLERAKQQHLNIDS